jgi:hypothetical protein
MLNSAIAVIRFMSVSPLLERSLIDRLHFIKRKAPEYRDTPTELFWSFTIVLRVRKQRG